MIVFDQDGRLPINLERTSLSGNKLPFEKELAEDVSCYFVNELSDKLSNHDKGLTKSLLKACIHPNISGLTSTLYAYESNISISKFLISHNKIIPFDSELLKQVRPKNLFFDSCINPENGLWNAPSLFEQDDQYYVCIKITSDAKSNRTNWIRTIMEIEQQPYYRSAFSYLPITGRRIIICKSEEERLVTPSYVPKTFWRRLTKEWENRNWIMYSLGQIEKFEGDIDSVVEYMENTGQFGVVQYQLNWDMEEDYSDASESIFSKVWLEKVGKPYIELK